MKKLFVVFAIIFTVITSVQAYEYDSAVRDGLLDNQKAGYNLQKKEWSRSLNPGDVIFSKRTTRGSGGYSEMEFRGEWMETGTTYQFFDVDKLIGYNAHELKFYEFYFNGKNLIKVELSPREVQKYFPDVKIIKISDFNDNKIVVSKPWFQKQTFMLLNDTNQDFYKYQFEKYKVYELINGIFEAKRPQTFKFSHFASRDPMFPVLEIKVKNAF